MLRSYRDYILAPANYNESENKPMIDELVISLSKEIKVKDSIVKDALWDFNPYCIEVELLKNVSKVLFIKPDRMIPLINLIKEYEKGSKDDE